MDQRLDTTESPPSYSSIAASSEPPQYSPPTAPPYPEPTAPAPYEPCAYYQAHPGSAHTPQQVQHVTSFVEHIVFACIVFWCCNWLFGFIAFILAS